MTIARVSGQTDQHAFTTSGTSIGMTFPQNVVSGNSVVCWTRSDNAVGGTIADDHSVTDDVGSSAYTKDHTVVIANEHRACIFSQVLGGSGSCTVTLSATGDGAARRVIAGMEYDITGGRSLDKVAGATGTGSTAADSGLTATTTDADELLFGGIGDSFDGTPYTMGSGWTKRTEGTSGGSRSMTGDRIVSATGQYKFDATASNAVEWTALIATYKATSAPVGNIAWITA